MIARGAEQRLRIAGIAKIGGVSSLGGATMAIFDFPVAQRLFDKEGKLDSISIAAEPGYTPRAARCARSGPLLPPNAQVRTGEAQAKQATNEHQRLPRRSSRTSCSRSPASRCSSAAS